MDWDQDGKTALYNACKQGIDRILQELSGKDADMDCINQHDNTELHTATLSGNESIVQILLNKGAKNIINNVNFEKMTALHIACMKGYVKIVKELIEKGADMDCVDRHGNTILHLATISGNKDLIQIILTKTDVKLINHENKHKETALHIACEIGHFDIVEELIKKGADMDCVDQYGNTILHAATLLGNENVVQILLTKVDTKLINHVNCCKQTALHIACEAGHFDIIEELIKKGADMDCVDKYGDTILHAAVRSGNHDVVQILLTKADIKLINRMNYLKTTALYDACKEGHLKIIKELIKNDADMYCVDEGGNTILHLASRSGNEDVVEVLLTKGDTELINRTNYSQMTALYEACKKGHFKIVEKLIKKGADMDCVDKHGDTILHLASRSCKKDVIQLLLTKADVKLINHKNVLKKTALHIACERRNFDIIEELIKKGSDMDYVAMDGNTILHLAIRSGNKDLIQIILTKADVKLINHKNNFKTTALHVACEAGHFHIIEELIKKGADMDCVDQYGDTILHAAVRSGNDDVVQILLTKGDVKLINRTNNSKLTALYDACKKGHIKIIEKLIKKRADMDCVDKCGDTILHNAIRSGKEDVVVLLLTKAGYKLINHRNKLKKTALYIACELGYFGMIEELIKNGAGMDRVDKHGDTILHTVLRSGNHDLVQMLLTKADITLINHKNKLKQTALHIACEKGHFDIIEELIKKGADMDCVDTRGDTILHAAMTPGNEDVVEMLLTKGNTTLINHKNHSKVTALYIACKKRHFKIIEKLIKKGADMDCVDTWGDTLLHLATRSGDEDVVEMLLTKWDTKLINHTNNREETALYIACKGGHFKIIEKLIKKGADMDCVDEHGNTILHLVSKSCKKDVIQLLLTKADVTFINHKNDLKKTALHIACEGRNFDIIEELIKKGSDMDCVDERGETALHIACSKNSPQIIKMLVDHGANIYLLNRKGCTAFYIAGSCIPNRKDRTAFYVAGSCISNRKDRTAFYVAGSFINVLKVILIRRVCIAKEDVRNSISGNNSFNVKILSKFVFLCVFELETMTKFKILDEFTIQTVFLQVKNPVYIRNTVLEHRIRDYLQSPDSIKQFPLYIGLLREAFTKSQCRINLFTKADQVLSTVMKNQWWGELPVELRDLVLQHLTNAELEKVVAFALD